MGLRWDEVPFGQAASSHLPGCNGRCKGKCSAEMSECWARSYPRDGQAPVCSETTDSAADRVPTAAEGVPVVEAGL